METIPYVCMCSWKSYDAFIKWEIGDTTDDIVICNNDCEINLGFQVRGQSLLGDRQLVMAMNQRVSGMWCSLPWCFNLLHSFQKSQRNLQKWTYKQFSPSLCQSEGVLSVVRYPSLPASCLVIVSRSICRYQPLTNECIWTKPRGLKLY